MSLSRSQKTFLGHPVALYYLSFIEMWERFSIYGIRAFLVLTLIAAVNSPNPGFGMSPEHALRVYAWYTGLIYLSSIFGGYVSDRFLGQRKSIMAGAIIICCGKFLLAYATPGHISLFFCALMINIVGHGLFKPNISTMVREIYPENDARYDDAFSIFYMGINLGAFIAPLICSYFAEDPTYGWRIGFFLCGIGMLIALLLQLLFANKVLGDIGKKVPSPFGFFKKTSPTDTPPQKLTPQEKRNIKVIVGLFVFVTLFWASFEQCGGSMNIYTDKEVMRSIGNFAVPTGWFQSLNPLFIIALAPLFSIFWFKVRKFKFLFSTPMKMAYGLISVAIGFAFLVFSVYEQKITGGKAPMIWLVLAYLFHTCGELCISPIGLSMIVSLSPKRLIGIMMGAWFCTNFVADLLAGYIGSFSATLGYMQIYLGLLALNVIFAIILFFFAYPMFKAIHPHEIKDGK